MKTVPQTEVSTSLPRYTMSLPFSERRVLLLVGDTICLLLALIAAYWMQLYLNREFVQQSAMVQGQMRWLYVLSVFWLGLAVVNEAYELQTAHQPAVILRGLLLTFIEAGVLYLLIFFVMGRSIYITIPLVGEQLGLGYFYTPPRTTASLFLLVALASTSLWRLGYIRLLVTSPWRRRAIIVGAGWAGRTLVQALHDTGFNYELVGFIDDDLQKQGETVQGLPVVGTRYDLLRQIQKMHANEIILAITNEIHSELFRILMICYEQGITIKPMSLLYEEVLGRIPVEHLGQKWLPTPFWDTPSLPTFYRLFKRLMDILLGTMGLVILGALLPFIALAIYLDSPGPIFYSQERLGKGGKGFRLLKFRSMIPNAENKGKAQWASRDDDRITGAGKFLRRTRMDELPQILNVLRGEMSIVGPRPERPEFVAELQEQIPFYRARLNVKPGLTGWAQIKYGYGNTVEDALIKLQYDLYYIKHQSLMLDILIILRTIKVMLMFKGT